MTSGIGGGAAIGVGQISTDSQNATPLTSPVRINAKIHSGGLVGRKRNGAGAGLDSSPGSIDEIDGGDDHEERKRQPVKRACNECRQQKVCTSVVTAYVVMFMLMYFGSSAAM